MRAFSDFSLYFWAASINGAVSQCTYSAAALPLVQRSGFQASSLLGALMKAGKFVFFRAVVWTAASPTRPPSAASPCIPCLMFSRSRWTEPSLTALATKVTAVQRSPPRRPCECQQNTWHLPYLPVITMTTSAQFARNLTVTFIPAAEYVQLKSKQFFKASRPDFFANERMWTGVLQLPCVSSSLSHQY